MKPFVLFLLAGLLVGGCAPTDAPEGATMTAPGVAATTAASTTTAEQEPSKSALPLPGETDVVYGRTAEGAFFQGAADAPVTLIDYSDFL